MLWLWTALLRSDRVLNASIYTFLSWLLSYYFFRCSIPDKLCDLILNRPFSFVLSILEQAVCDLIVNLFSKFCYRFLLCTEASNIEICFSIFIIHLFNGSELWNRLILDIVFVIGVEEEVLLHLSRHDLLERVRCWCVGRILRQL